MKGIVVTRYGGPEVLQVQDVPGPEPKDGEVLVNIEAAGVNFADISMMNGKYAGGAPPPFTAGREFAGRILSTGERVMGYTQSGAFAERIALRRDLLWPLPENWNMKEAAAFPVNFFTAYFAFVSAGLAHADRSSSRPKVLIHAVAGGVGTAAVQIAKILGIETFGTSSSDEKLARAKTLGLSRSINYKKVDYEDAIREMTNGEGVDAAFEMLGGEHTGKSMRCLKFRGHLVTYGSAAGTPPQVDIRTLYAKNISVDGLWLTQISTYPDLMREAWSRLREWAAAGRLHPAIGHEMNIDNAADAFRLMLNRENFGKIVLTV